MAKMHIWAGRSRRVGQPTVEDDRDPAFISAAIAKLDEVHASGTPIFTRELIMSVFGQIKRPLSRGDAIVVVGLDGVEVDFDVDIGMVPSWISEEHPDKELVVTQPCIGYEAIEHLRHDLVKGYIKPHLAYCPIRVHHLRAWRDKKTMEFVSEFPIASAADVEQLFHDSIHLWEQSDTCQQLKTTLREAKVPCKITNIVGFACGELSLQETFKEGAKRSATQHALLLTLREVLKDKGKTDLKRPPCYVQDPAYNLVDKTVLGNAEIEVVDDPEGFLLVNDGSVVFSCAPNIPVKQVIADLARPAILVWSPPTVLEEIVTDPDSPRVFQMLRDYDEFEFVPHADFCPMSIYIRRC